MAIYLVEHPILFPFEIDDFCKGLPILTKLKSWSGEDAVIWDQGTILYSPPLVPYTLDKFGKYMKVGSRKRKKEKAKISLIWFHLSFEIIYWKQ